MPLAVLRGLQAAGRGRMPTAALAGINQTLWPPTTQRVMRTTHTNVTPDAFDEEPALGRVSSLKMLSVERLSERAESASLTKVLLGILIALTGTTFISTYGFHWYTESLPASDTRHLSKRRPRGASSSIHPRAPCHRHGARQHPS